MADRPILFSGPMVRALLDGRKRQTRRVLRIPNGFRVENLAESEPEHYSGLPGDASSWGNNYADDGGPLTLWELGSLQFLVGDRLWVREGHYLTDTGDLEEAVCIADDAAVKEHLARIARIERAHPTIDLSRHKRRRPGIHMPRWASRLTLTVTDVRVERLQDISPADAKAEGADALADNPFGSERDALPSYRWGFAALWASINGASSWSVNPWVVALNFAVTTANIDTLPNREAA